MKRVMILLILGIFLTSMISAEIIITEQPNELYSLGEIIHIPVKLSNTLSIEDFFLIHLICNGIESEIHKQYISLPSGGEVEINSNVRLTTEFIGKSSGICSIKAILGNEYLLTNEFGVSNLISIDIETKTTEVKPGEYLIIEGTAKKENGENVEGFIELSITGANIVESNTVKNGYFFLNVTIPKKLAAQQYLTNLDIYEKDTQGTISNTGFINYNIKVSQVPTSLEIIFGESEIEPGEDFKVKAILHDQTGEKIDTAATITIRNERNKVIEQQDLSTDEYIEYPVEYNYPPVQWAVHAISEELEITETINISKKEFAKIELINKTIIITNKGNVPYNETIVIKIGNQTTDFASYVEVDEIQKYSLSAPEGEYIVQVNSGSTRINKTVMLTGNTINVKEISSGIRMPFVWIFIIGILGFMVFVIYKKGYKKAFIGYIQKRRTKRKEKKTEQTINQNNISRNKAELSLSIRGEKQDTSLICLKIKNYKETINNEAIQNKLAELAKIAESEKAVTYKNQENIFFLFVPIKTKTFKNQTTAAKAAKEIKEALEKYNKMAKDKIHFGLSLNYGTIIAKEEKSSLKFMSMGTFITTAKKLAALSEGEVYLTKKMNEKLLTEAKTEKHHKKGTEVFIIKEMRNKGENNKKFLNDFVKRLGKNDSQNNSK